MNCPNCNHGIESHFASADDFAEGSCWETPMCNCEWLPETIRTNALQATIDSLTAERDALKFERDEAVEYSSSVSSGREDFYDEIESLESERDEALAIIERAKGKLEKAWIPDFGYSAFMVTDAIAILNGEKP